jgi:hypothetical protein
VTGNNTLEQNSFALSPSPPNHQLGADANPYHLGPDNDVYLCDDCADPTPDLDPATQAESDRLDAEEE